MFGEQMFDYLRENPDVLGKGLAGVAIFIVLLILFLEWRYGILDDPKQRINEENR